MFRIRSKSRRSRMADMQIMSEFAKAERLCAQNKQAVAVLSKHLLEKEPAGLDEVFKSIEKEGDTK